MTPSQTDTAARRTGSYSDVLKAFWYFLEQDKAKFLFWNITLFLINFVFLIPPILIGFIADFFISYTLGDPLTIFYKYIALVGGIYIIAAVMRLLSKKVIAKIGARLTYDVRVKGYARLLDFPLSWHQEENSGNRIERINEGSKDMSGWTKIMANEIYPIFSTFIGVVIIFIYLDWSLLAFFMTYLGLFYLNETWFNKRISKSTLERNKVREKASGTFYEGTSNITTIKAMGAKQSMAQSVFDAETKTKIWNIKLVNTGINKWMSFQILNGLALFAFLYLTGRGVLMGVISPAFFVVYFTYYEKMRKATGDVSSLANTLIEMKTSVLRMMPIFTEKAEQHFGTQTFPQNWSVITLKNIGFSYKQNGQEKTIRNLNFTLRKGEKIGVVGESGSGKSTLVKLFAGLYKIDTGSIDIDGVDYYSISHDEILKQVGFVLQETELFNMTLYDNITMLQPLSEEEVKKAVKQSSLHKVVLQLPQGLHTLIGEKGYRLSGGERQRVGIARALCQKSSILFLDEATSSLDSETEKSIQHSLENCFKEETMIVVAHRLSTLRNVDRILVFDKGKIVEEGSYIALLRKKGVFAKLAQKK